MVLTCLLALMVLAACGDADDNGTGEEVSNEFGIAGGQIDEFGKPTFDNSGWEEPGGKADAILGRRGLSTSVDGGSLSVWEVRNQWEDTDTAEASKPGMAWGEDSGLTWDEKYQAWVASMKKIDSEGFGETFELVTPFNKTLPAPSLECAEVAMFLRVTFASWYNLPFFMEARDSNGKRLYFGHFGIRTEDGRYGRTPQFRDIYPDHTDKAQDVIDAKIEWPRDEKLAAKSLPGSFDDEQPMLGEDKHAGAYFDEVYLNKRVGHFMRLLLVYFGSVNLADSVNTYNVKAETVSPGDVLLERSGSSGIGHTLVTLQVSEVGQTEIDGETFPLLEAELASGSMPRRQPRWDSPAVSKRYFTDETAGGEEYAKFGGGIKRWRVASSIDGRWTNIVPSISKDDFISSRDLDAVAQRIERFEKVLTELTPEEKLQVIADIIEVQREHLRRLPASCSARIRRENAFKELYELAAELEGWDRAEVDRRYRNLEDYVLAELVYEESKTCCWNSSTAEMFEIIMDHARLEKTDPETGECREVTVFMNRDDEGDGFQVFADFAEATGRGDQWRAWSADETCPQAEIPQATEADHAWTPLCGQ